MVTTPALGQVVVLYSIMVRFRATQLTGGGFVGWEPHSGRKQNVFLCGVSYWPISTGQLHESLVLASTSGLSTQWSGWGPLTRKVCGNLILKRASRLDAFSGYPIRTKLISGALGSTTDTPEVRPSRSSRTRDSSSQVSCARGG